MKLRWTRHSIRFRITPSELESLVKQQSVRESLALPGGAWVAALVPGEFETTLAMTGNELRLTLSVQDCARLADAENEGVYFETEAEPPLHYYVEKDFPCVHPRASEAADLPTETFIAPEDFAQRKLA